MTGPPSVASAQSEPRHAFARWLRIEPAGGPLLPDELTSCLRGADSWSGRTVYVKPNFTAPAYRPGVTTSPEVLEAVVEALCILGSRPVIVESDGSLDSWTADEAFEGHGVRRLEQRFGVPAVNLSRERTVRTALPGGSGGRIEIDLPSRLMEEPGILFSVPVLKTHAFTTVTLGLKNLWGCIPSSKRLLHHAKLSEVLSGMLALWGPGWSLIDGTWAMDGFGPIRGEVFPLNVLLLTAPLLVGDILGSRFMGIDERSVFHLQYALRMHSVPAWGSDGEPTAPVAACRRFQPKGDLLQRIAQVIFHSRTLTRLAYLSPLASLKNHLVRMARKPSF